MNATLLRTGWRAIRLPVVLVAAYLVLRVVVSALSARHGFGSPDGLSPVFVFAAAMLVVLRVVLLVVVPTVLICRVVMWTVDRFVRHPKGRTATAEATAVDG
ncbi:hypothetical protein ACFC06_06500 [Nocardia sp. NPDC056064]|uniref:hypothetical protein n=1 Tax=Nocardia sp. NPDC056064 TaxID=3345701 RepID=UPI0035D97812